MPTFLKLTFAGTGRQVRVNMDLVTNYVRDVGLGACLYTANENERFDVKESPEDIDGMLLKKD